jgi:hypothetical protein
MELTCTYCKKPFNVNPAEAASAVIDYTFGKKTHNFVCDNCHKENSVTKEAYNAAKDAAEKPQPVAGPKPVAMPVAAPVAKPPVIKPVAAPAPAPKPVAKPAPTMAPQPISPVGMPAAKKRTAVVTTRSLHVRKDHSTTSETMAGLNKGDKVEVLTTWSDGKNTWAQIGPDRWAAMVYNGDTLMEFES